MAKKISVINTLRPKIKSQGIVDFSELSRRIAKQSTTFDEDEMFGIFRKMIREIMEALQRGETVRLDGLLLIQTQMKVGGEVTLSLRADSSALSKLQDPALWTADKVANHQNLRKSVEELLAQWDEMYPANLVEPD